MDSFFQMFSQYGLAGLCVAYLIYDRFTASKNMTDILKEMKVAMTQITTNMLKMSETMDNINERLIIIETHLGLKNKE